MTGWVHTSDSANIAYYRKGSVWVEALYSAIAKDPVTKKWKRKVRPDYHLVIHRDGEGEVARTIYTPCARPESSRLSPRTIARLVREVGVKP